MAGALDRARLGNTEVVLLTGRPGTGITALGTWFVQRSLAESIPASITSCAPGDRSVSAPLARAVHHLWIDGLDQRAKEGPHLRHILEPHAAVAHHLLPGTLDWLPAPPTRQQTLPEAGLLVLSAVLSAGVAASHPGAIFIDDLEEAQPGTLTQISGIAADPRIRGLVLILGVQSGGPRRLEEVRHQLRRRGVRWRELPVSGLDAEAIAEWTADRATVNVLEGLQLSRAIAQGSDGRPGAIDWILKRAHSGGLLSPGAPRAQTVLRTLAARAEGWQHAVSLRHDVTRVLSSAALFCSPFTQELLATAAEMTTSACATAVSEAASASLLVEHPGQRFAFRRSRARDDFDTHTPEQLASIGRRLHHRHWEESALADRISILTVLARAMEHLSSDEVQSLASSAHAAGRSAHRAGALEVAAHAFDIGLNALRSPSAADHRRLTLALHHSSAEVARKLDDEVKMKYHLQAAADLVDDPVEGLPGVLTKIWATIDVRDYGTALKIGEVFMSDVERPLAPASWISLIWTLLRVLWGLFVRGPSTYLERPAPRDPVDIAVQLVRMETTPAEALLRPKEVPTRVLQDVLRVMRQGAVGPSAFVWFGVAIFHLRLGATVRAERWAALATELARRRGDLRWTARIVMYRNLVLVPWESGLQTAADAVQTSTLPYLTRGEGAPWTATGVALVYRILAGESPTDVAREAERLVRQARALEVKNGVETLRNVQGFCRGARGEVREPGWTLSDEPGVNRTVQGFRMLLALQRGDRSQAASFMWEPLTDDFLESAVPILFVAELYWLACLPLAIDSATVTWTPQRRRAKRALRLIKMWGRREERRYQLLWARASVSHSRGAVDVARPLFDEALDGAIVSNCLHDAIAIAATASILARHHGDERRAQALQDQATSLRQQWLGTPTLPGPQMGGDLLQVAVSVAQETEVEPLLASALQGVHRYTGCERGVVLLVRDGALEVSAQIMAGLMNDPDPEGLPQAWLRGLAAQDQIGDRTGAEEPALCMPLSRGGPLYGLLYLEGPALRPEMVEPLQVITTQVAVGLENLELVRDLESKMLERTEQLQQALERAEAANRAKSVFLGRMSHELKTPLNAILGLADHLENDGRNPPHVVQRARTIHTSGAHLLGVIGDVMDMATIEAGRIELYPTHLDLRGAVRACIDMTSEAARKRGLQLSCHVADGVPISVRIDASRLRQVLLNLLGNAVKFTPSGTVELHVLIEIQDEARVLRIDIRDTGFGIDTADISRIFEPFEQAGAVEQKREGAGLGLAISAHFIEEMGGRLTAASRIAGGSTFSVLLPLEPLEPGAPGEAVDLKIQPPVERLPEQVLRQMRSDAAEGRLAAVQELASGVQTRLPHYAPTLQRVLRFTQNLQERDLCAFLDRVESDP